MKKEWVYNVQWAMSIDKINNLKLSHSNMIADHHSMADPSYKNSKFEWVIMQFENFESLHFFISILCLIHYYVLVCAQIIVSFIILFPQLWNMLSNSHRVARHPSFPAILSNSIVSFIKSLKPWPFVDHPRGRNQSKWLQFRMSLNKRARY